MSTSCMDSARSHSSRPWYIIEEDIFGNRHNLDIGSLAWAVRAIVMGKTGWKEASEIAPCSSSRVVSEKEYYILGEQKKWVSSLNSFPSYLRYIHQYEPEKTRWLLWDACRYHKLRQGLVLIAADSWEYFFRSGKHSLRFMKCGPWSGQSILLYLYQKNISGIL